MSNTIPAACRGLEKVYMADGLAGPPLEGEMRFGIAVEGHWSRPEGDYLFKISKEQNRHLEDIEFVPPEEGDPVRPNARIMARIRQPRFAASIVACEIRKITAYLQSTKRTGEWVQGVTYESENDVRFDVNHHPIGGCKVRFRDGVEQETFLLCSLDWPPAPDEPEPGSLYVRFNRKVPSQPLVDGAMRALLQELEKK